MIPMEWRSTVCEAVVKVWRGLLIIPFTGTSGCVTIPTEGWRVGSNPTSWLCRYR